MSELVSIPTVSAQGEAIASRESVWVLFLRRFRHQDVLQAVDAVWSEGGDSFRASQRHRRAATVLGEHADSEPL